MEDLSEVRKVLQGKSIFVGDILDPKALWVKVKRAAIPHGRIEGLVFPPFPPYVRIIRSKDIPGKRTISFGKVEIPLLNESEVRYVGEPILLLVGPDPEELERLSQQIVVLYEELPANFEIPLAEEGQKESLHIEKTIQRGNPEEAFKKSHRILEREYSTGFQEHYYSEPHGAYVHWDNEKTTLDIHIASRWPFHVHRVVKESLALPWELVSVSIPPDPDTSLDGKLWYPSFVSAHAALAAWLTRRSIKYLYSRQEDFLFTPKRAPSTVRLRAGLDGEGKLEVLEAEILFNMGAYPVFAEELLDRAIYALGVLYSCPNLLIRGRVITSCLPPTGAFSGMGGSQSLFALEVFTDEIRQELGVSPTEWKTRNLATKQRPKPWGAHRKQFFPPSALLETVLQASDFERRHATLELLRKHREQNPESFTSPEFWEGIGIALGAQGSGFFLDREHRSKVEVRMTKDKKVSIHTSAVPGSYALKSIWKTIASESLGVQPSSVFIEPIRTRSTQDSGPSIFSRNITLTTKLIEQCCSQLKKSLPAGLPAQGVKSLDPRYARSWNRETFLGNPFTAISWAAAVVEVRIDPLSLVPQIEHVWMSIDAGRILDEKEARRTIELGIAQAVGWTLLEHVFYVEGRIPPPLFSNYRICSPSDLPTPHIEFLPSEDHKNVKGLGELALNVIPAALINALSQGLGKRIRAIPKREDVLL